MDARTIEELRRRGHDVGATTGISPEGKILVSIDGAMMTYAEIDALLERERTESDMMTNPQPIRFEHKGKRYAVKGERPNISHPEQAKVDLFLEPNPKPVRTEECDNSELEANMKDMESWIKATK
jgi:hypothetical protein